MRWNSVLPIAGYTAIATIGLALSIAPEPAHAADDTLRVGHASLPPSRGVPYQGRKSPTGYSWSPIFDTLTNIGNDGLPQPQLALSWKAVSSTAWHFTVRPNLKFSNGETLNAAAIVATLDWLRSDDGASTVIGQDAKEWNAAAQAVDEQTVEIRTATPLATLPGKLSLVFFVAPKAWSELGREQFAVSPVGSGAYKVVSWRADQVELAANEASWRQPKTKKLQLVALPEMTARAQALISGQIDAATGLSFDALGQIRAAGMKADVYPAPYILAWPYFSHFRKTPFNDVRVRQAANYAVNKEAIITNLLAGNGFASGQGATRETFGYNPEVKAYPYDPKMAKQLLAEAGYPNGFKTTVEVLPGNFPADNEIYQQVAQDLGKVGIAVSLRSITFPDHLAKIRPKANSERMLFDDDVFMFQADISLDGDEASRAYRSYSCRRKPGFYCDEAELKDVEKAEAEFDSAKRRLMLQNLMKRFHDNAPALFLTELVDIVAYSAKVHDFKMTQRVLTYDAAAISN